MSIYMVEKKELGPKKRKRRKAKQKPKAGQTITQKVVVNVGKSVPKRKRTTGTQAKRSVQPEIRYQPAPIPLQPNYSTQINDLTRKIEEPTEKLIDLQNQLTLYAGQRFQPPAQLPTQPPVQPISNDELDEASRLARGRSQSRRRSLSIKADPDPVQVAFQPQNDFVSGAEEPLTIQKPEPGITLLPKTKAQKQVEKSFEEQTGRGRKKGQTKAKKQAEAPGQTRIEESLKKEIS